MTLKTNAAMQRVQKLNHVQKEGPNWVLIAGCALLSTLTVKFGCRLKQSIETRRQDAFNKGGGLEVAKEPKSLVANYSDISLPLVEIPTIEANKVSSSSDSPRVSESGSDVYCKREVIQKLRQQLKSRDEMILEMQIQITELHNSLNIQSSLSANLQAQLDCTTRDLFTSEREIQRLRKVIADHCVAEVISHEKPVGPPPWHHQEAANVSMTGYTDRVDDGKAPAERERIEMLRRAVQELKEVIEGKDFLLNSYKEQKAEMCSKIKELQLRLDSQLPNFL